MGSAIVTYSGQRLVPAFPGGKEVPVTIAASQSIARGTVLGQVGAINDVQTLAITGSPSGGTWSATILGYALTGLAYNITPANLLAALIAAGMPVGSASVTGTAGTSYVVTALGPLSAAPQTLATVSGAGLTGGTSPAVTATHTTTGVVSGAYKAYSSAATDGSQVAKGLLEYDIQTDSSGNITYSATSGQAGGPWGETYLLTPMYYKGTFRTQDLIGLDANALTNLGAKVVEGSLASGIIEIP